MNSDRTFLFSDDLQLSQHMKLKLQFTASVSTAPPDARPLSRKNAPRLRISSILRQAIEETSERNVDNQMLGECMVSADP